MYINLLVLYAFAFVEGVGLGICLYVCVLMS